MSTDVTKDVASICSVERHAKQKFIMKKLASLLPCRLSVFYLLDAGLLFIYLFINIIFCLTFGALYSEISVELGSNTSTVTLRVMKGDKKGAWGV
jgi:hypothetical protein